MESNRKRKIPEVLLWSLHVHLHTPNADTSTHHSCMSTHTCMREREREGEPGTATIKTKCVQTQNCVILDIERQTGQLEKWQDNVGVQKSSTTAWNEVSTAGEEH